MIVFVNIKYILNAYQRVDNDFDEINFKNMFFFVQKDIKCTLNVYSKKRDSRENVIVVDEKNSRDKKRIVIYS